MLANNAVTVYRGTRLNEFLDEVDTDIPIARDIPADLQIETTSRYSQMTGKLVIIERYSLAIRSIELKTGDRIQDNSKDWYTVELVHRPNVFGFSSTLFATLRKDGTV